MQRGLPRILSVNAGFMDTAAFLALKGLFTAHVTGNFVTLGASLVLGTSGALAKLLALPVFCIVVILARLSSYGLRARSLPVMSTLLAVQLALMILGAVLATLFGPFANADGYAALVTGMTLVAAMAIQNAAHRVHLASSPPSTIMTGTTPDDDERFGLRRRLYPGCTSVRMAQRLVLLGTAGSGSRRAPDAQSPRRRRHAAIIRGLERVNALHPSPASPPNGVPTLRQMDLRRTSRVR